MGFFADIDAPAIPLCALPSWFSLFERRGYHRQATRPSSDSGAAVSHCNYARRRYLEVFVDGAQNGSDQADPGNNSGFGIPAATAPLTIGPSFNGQLDEVEIFNRALDPNEIASIYDAGSGGKCKLAGPTDRQLANISSRADVGTGDNVEIGGFIIRSDPSTRDS